MIISYIIPTTIILVVINLDTGQGAFIMSQM